MLRRVIPGAVFMAVVCLEFSGSVLAQSSSAGEGWSVIHNDNFGPAPKQTDTQVGVYDQSMSPQSTDSVTQISDVPSDEFPDLARQYLESARWYERKGDTGRLLDNLKSAANYASAGAHYELAKIYTKGDLVPRDLDKASVHLHAAAALGNAEADRVLGRMLLQGDLGYRDARQGEERLIQAAKTSIRAKRELGMWYAGMIDGTPKDIRAGFNYLNDAANMGDELSAEYLQKIDTTLLSESSVTITEDRATSLGDQNTGQTQAIALQQQDQSALDDSSMHASVPALPVQRDPISAGAMPSADTLFTEANKIMLRPQNQRSLEEEAKAYAMFSLAFELGSDMAGKELNYLDGVRAIKAKQDPQWLFKYKQLAIQQLQQ